MPIPTGGAITTDGLYTVHTFTTSSDFVVSNNGSISVLIVGGGGSSGGADVEAAGNPGGGGAGGYLEGTETITSGTYPVVVGTGGTYPGQVDVVGPNGNLSSFNSHTASGGGGGGAVINTAAKNGVAGGSGGGGGSVYSGTGASGNQASSSPLTGYKGNGANGGATSDGGGGGGAGGNASTVTGGAGKASSITGASVTYATGGNSTGGHTTGYGNGGTYHSGDDGIVIIRYLTATFTPAAGELLSKPTLLGPNELYTHSLFSDANLVAYYRMESGALTTDSKGANTLTNYNTVADGIGKFGGGADFGASNTDKALRVASDLGIGATTNITASIWVKLNTEISTGEYTFIDKNKAGATGTLIQIYYEYNGGTRRLNFRRLGSANAAVTYNLTLGTSNWYHLVLTWDGTNMYAYVNGVSVGSAASSGTFNLTAYADQLAIGTTNSVDNVRYSSAIIDDVAIFSRALTASEVSQLYGAIAYYKLESSSDDSKGVFTGTDTGITYGTAKFGNGAGFVVASSSKIVLPATFPSLTNDWTISMWVKRGRTGAVIDSIYSRWANSTTRRQLFIYFDSTVANAIRVDIPYIKAIMTTNGTISDTTTWHHLAFTKSGTTWSTYIDGVLDKQVTDATAQEVNTTDTPSLGADIVTPQYSTQTLDDISFFSRALSATEVAQLYNDVVTGRSYMTVNSSYWGG